MKSNRYGIIFGILTALLLLTGVGEVWGQTPGQIFKPATGVKPNGQLVLDPNGDGFISSPTCGPTGFTDKDLCDDLEKSEVRFFALPTLMNEPVGDPRTGPTGGHTEIVDGINDAGTFMYSDDFALYFRMRIAKSSNASKGYAFLISTGNTDFSNVANNPGFDFEVVLQTGGGSPGVNVYNWETGSPVKENWTTGSAGSLNIYHQLAVSGPRYQTEDEYVVFYDFYIPWSELNTHMGLMTPTTPFRASALTITNAGSGISGVSSDINGIDDNLFPNPVAALTTILNTFPSTTPEQLNENYVGTPGFGGIKSNAPNINQPIYEEATTVSGTSTESNGTIIDVDLYNSSGVYVKSYQTTVSNFQWSISPLSTDLDPNYYLVATATASGKSESNESPRANVLQIGAQLVCTAMPTSITQSGGGPNNVMTGTVSGTAVGTNNTNLVIRGWNAGRTQMVFSTRASDGATTTVGLTFTQATGAFTLANPSNNYYSNLPTGTIVTAQVDGQCESDYAQISAKVNQIAAPVITSTDLTPASTSITGTVSTSGATILLYKNSIYLTSVVASGTSWTVNSVSMSNGDQFFARAQSGANAISIKSNTVVVGASAPVESEPPTILGSYTSDSTSVRGISNEVPGTEIKLYSGSTLVGTTNVNAFGGWEITGLTLSVGNILTATALAPGKLLSDPSNAITVRSGPVPVPTVGPSSIFPSLTSVTINIGNNSGATTYVYADGVLLGQTTGGSLVITNSDLLATIREGVEIYAYNYIAGAVSEISNIVVVSASPASAIQMLAVPSGPFAGENSTIYATVVDAFGGAKGSGISVTFSIDDGEGVLVGSTTKTTNSFGQVSIVYTTDTTPETSIIRASGPSNAYFNTVNVVSQAPPTRPDAITFNPTNGATNIAVDATVSVLFDEDIDSSSLSGLTISDSGGNLVSGVSGSLSGSGNRLLTIAHNNFSEGETYTVTVPSFSVLNAGGNGNPTTSWSFSTVSSAVPNSISLTGPATVEAGATSTNFTLTILDDNDDPVVVSQNTTFSLATNQESGTATFTPTSVTVNAGSSSATFTYSNTKVGSGTHTITASRTGGDALPGGASDTHDITVTAGPAAQLVFGQGPTNALAGASLNPAVTVRIEDQYGNLTNSTSTVYLTIGTNPADPDGTLSGDVDVAAVSGVATFSDLSIDKAGTGYTLVASDATPADGNTGLDDATSSTFNITPAAAAKYLVTASTTSPVAGGDVTITAQLADQYDNPVSTAGVEVSWTKSDANGSFASATSDTDANGQASVVLTTHTVSGTSTTVTGTSAGPITGTSPTITTRADGATQFIVSLPGEAFTNGAGNSGTASDQTVGVQFTVELRAVDNSGNTDPNFDGVKTVNWSGAADAPGGNTPSYTTLIEFTDGVATTTLNTTLFAAESDVQLTANQDGGEDLNGTSNTFNVLPGAISASESDVVATSPVTAGQNSTVTITLRDQYGNLLGGKTDSDVSLALTGDATEVASSFNETSTGVYTINITNETAETVTVTATVSSVELDDKPEVTFNPGPISASNSSVTVDPSVLAVNDNSTMTITLRDAFNNVITGLDLSDIIIGLTGDATVVANSLTEVGNGVYTAEITNATAEEITVTVTADAVELDDEPTVTFEGAPIVSVDEPDNVTITNGTLAVTIEQPETAVATLSADKTVTWSLNGGANAALFQVNASGELSFINASVAQLDAYVVVVRATDEYDNTTDVTVSVTVIQTDAPVVSVVEPDDVTITSGTLNITIDAPDQFVATLSANKEVTWSITGGANQALFTATPDNNTGNVSIDFTNASVASLTPYVVQVTAEDAFGNTRVITVNVTVNDPNPPVVSVDEPDDAEYDANAGTLAVTIEQPETAVATLSADKTVTWSLNGGANAALFQVNASGELSFINASVAQLDAYVVVVRATDEYDNTTDVTVSVTVIQTDAPVVSVVEPDDVTITSGTLNVTIDAPAQFVAELSANKEVTWSIIGGANQALFTATPDNNTGSVSIDFTNASVASLTPYVVQVTAEDAFGNTRVITVNVTVNDPNPPIVSVDEPDGVTITNGVLDVSILAPEQSVATLNADKDVTWSISGGVNSSLFEVNSNGEVSFINASVASTIPYVVEVTAEDAFGNISTVTVNVTVIQPCDVNGNNASISGYVRNSDNNTPLANVMLTLIPQGDTEGPTLIRVTDQDGYYEITGVPAGRYLLQVQDENLGYVQNLFPVNSSLFFTTLASCEPQTHDYLYGESTLPVLAGYVWYDVNGDGIVNEWYDANDDGEVTQNFPGEDGTISRDNWEWIDLNNNGRYDLPEDLGELNRAGFGNTAFSNVQIDGPNGYENEIIVGIRGYWRTRPGDDDFAPGVQPWGQYNVKFVEDAVIRQMAEKMNEDGLVKPLEIEVAFGKALASTSQINSNASGNIITSKTLGGPIATTNAVGPGSCTFGDDTIVDVQSGNRIHNDINFGLRCFDATENTVDVPNGTVYELTTVTITILDDEGNPIPNLKDKLNVTMTGSNEDEDLSEIVDNGDGTYTITYTPKVVGTDFFTVTLEGDELPGGPFPSQVGPGPADAGNTTANVPNGLAGVPTTVTITVRDEYDNLVTGQADNLDLAVVGGPNEGADFTDIVDNGDGTYTATYTPSGAGTDQIRIRLNGDAINGSPFNSVVGIGNPVADNTTAVVPNGTAGVPTEITITVRDGEGNLVSGAAGLLGVSIGGANDGAPVTAIVDNGDGTYTVRYTPLVTGTDQVRITLGGNPISGSPFPSVVTTGAISASNSSVTVSPASLPVGGTSTVTITLRDANNNPINGLTANEIATSLTGDATVVPGSFVSLGNGVYTVGVTNNEIEQNTVTVTARGVELNDNPVITFTVGAPVAQNSTASVPGGFVGQPTTIVITLRDQFNNPVPGAADQLSLAVSGANAGAPFTNIIDNGDGTYTVSYTPTRPGDDQIAINLNGQPINGSPYPSTVIGQMIIGAQNLPAWTENDPGYFTRLTVTGGVGPYSWAVIGERPLPPGLTLDPVTGEISGTPTQNGTYTFTVEVEDENGTVVTRDFTIIIREAEVALVYSLVFTQSPNDVTEAGNQIGTIVVEVQDQFGAINLDFNGLVSIDITEGTGGPFAEDAVLIGTTEVFAVNGVATFPGIVMERAGVDYTLTATADDINDGISEVFTVTPGPPWRLDVRELAEADTDEFGNPLKSGSAETSSSHHLEGNRIPMIMTVFDEFDNRTGVPEGDTPVLLVTSSVTGQFYRDQTETTPVDRIIIPVGQPSAIFFYEDPTPGELIINGTPQPPPGAREITPDDAPLVIRMPASLRSLPEAYTAQILQIKPVVVSLRSADNIAVRAPNPGVDVTLQSSSSTGVFYSDAAGTNVITRTTILPAESSVRVFYADVTLGTHTLTFTGAGIPDPTDETLVTIIHGPAVAANSQIVVPDGYVGEQTVSVLTLFDELGNSVYDAADQIAVSIGEGPNAGFDFTIVDNGDGTYNLIYTPQTPGVDMVSVVINGTEMPQSPLPSRVRDSEPFRLVKISGDEQVVHVVGTSSEGLKTQALGRFDNPIEGANIRYTIIGTPSGAAQMSMDPAEVRSGADGFAESLFKAGTKVGAYEVMAYIPQVDTVYFNMNVIPCIPTFGTDDPCGPYTYEVTSNNYAPDVNGTVAVLAQLTDRFGNATPHSGVEVTWSTNNAGTFSAVTSLTNEQGVATISYTVNNIVGSIHNVTATDMYTQTGTSPDIIPQGGGLAFFKIVGPDSVKVGVTGGPYELILMDEFENEIIANRNISFQLSIEQGQNFEVFTMGESSNLSRAGGNIITVQDRASRSRFYFKQNKTGQKLITGSVLDDIGIPDSTKNVLFYNEPGDAQILTLVAGQGQKERILNQLAERLTVTVIDQFDNPIPNLDVTFTLTGTPQGARQMSMAGNSVVAKTAGDNEVNSIDDVAPVTMTTDSLGRAGVVFYLGDKAGSYYVEATGQGLNTVEFEVEALPGQYTLYQNYPNPFNAGTKILYEVPVDSDVTITLYNAIGQRVATLVQESKATGVYTIDLDMNRLGLTSGVYIYHMSAFGAETGSQYVKTQKLLYVK